MEWQNSYNPAGYLHHNSHSFGEPYALTADVDDLIDPSLFDSTPDPRIQSSHVPTSYSAWPSAMDTYESPLEYQPVPSTSYSNGMVSSSITPTPQSIQNWQSLNETHVRPQPKSTGSATVNMAQLYSAPSGPSIPPQASSSKSQPIPIPKQHLKPAKKSVNPTMEEVKNMTKPAAQNEFEEMRTNLLRKDRTYGLAGSFNRSPTPLDKLSELIAPPVTTVGGASRTGTPRLVLNKNQVLEVAQTLIKDMPEAYVRAWKSHPDALRFVKYYLEQGVKEMEKADGPGPWSKVVKGLIELLRKVRITTHEVGQFEMGGEFKALFKSKDKDIKALAKSLRDDLKSGDAGAAPEPSTTKKRTIREISPQNNAGNAGNKRVKNEDQASEKPAAPKQVVKAAVRKDDKTDMSAFGMSSAPAKPRRAPSKLDVVSQALAGLDQAVGTSINKPKPSELTAFDRRRSKPSTSKKGLNVKFKDESELCSIRWIEARGEGEGNEAKDFNTKQMEGEGKAMKIHEGLEVQQDWYNPDTIDLGELHLPHIAVESDSGSLSTAYNADQPVAPSETDVMAIGTEGAIQIPKWDSEPSFVNSSVSNNRPYSPVLDGHNGNVTVQANGLVPPPAAGSGVDLKALLSGLQSKTNGNLSPFGNTPPPRQSTPLDSASINDLLKIVTQQQSAPPQAGYPAPVPAPFPSAPYYPVQQQQQQPLQQSFQPQQFHPSNMMNGMMNGMGLQGQGGWHQQGPPPFHQPDMGMNQFQPNRMNHHRGGKQQGSFRPQQGPKPCFEKMNKGFCQKPNCPFNHDM